MDYNDYSLLAAFKELQQEDQEFTRLVVKVLLSLLEDFQKNGISPDQETLNNIRKLLKLMCN